MTSNHRSQDDRPTTDGETLCALFDGQLQGDAARFAVKRLGHDAQWRQACGRWQLYGDVMRGQATGVAAGGFAERVALAIALEAPLATAQPANEPRQTPVATARHGSRRGWIGGALAASVAMAALFVTRPFSDPQAPSTPDSAPAQVASVTAPVATPAVPAPTPAPKAPDQGVGGLEAAAVAVAEVPRRAVERRSARSQNQRAALRASRPVQPTVAVASAPATAVAALPAHSPTTQPANPFQPQHEEAATRPWPRAVLPQYSSSGAMTASYGTSAGASFYPFEPSLENEAAARSQDHESDAPPPH